MPRGRTPMGILEMYAVIPAVAATRTQLTSSNEWGRFDDLDPARFQLDSALQRWVEYSTGPIPTSASHASIFFDTHDVRQTSQRPVILDGDL
jgi:hypothetical protein